MFDEAYGYRELILGAGIYLLHLVVMEVKTLV